MPPRKKQKTTLTFDDHMGRVVDSKRIKREMTVDELADMSAIGYTTLRRRLAGAGFTVLELERIAVAVDTPASSMVEEALRDYGGMEKLLAEHVSDDAANVSAEDNVSYMGHVSPPEKIAAKKKRDED